MGMPPSRATRVPPPLAWTAGAGDPGGAPDRPPLVLLHGAGDDPADMLAWADAVDTRGRFRAFAVGAPFGTGREPTWFTSTPRGPVASEVRTSLDRLGATMGRLCDEPGVSADPAAVVGYSQGGAMALLLASDPVTVPVGAAVSVCGWLPDVEDWPARGRIAPGGVPTRRVLVLNARDDDVVPVDFGEAAALTLRAAGLSVELRVVDGTHRPAPAALAAVGEWLSRPDDST
jgi:predicted esterase